MALSSFGMGTESLQEFIFFSSEFSRKKIQVHTNLNFFRENFYRLSAYVLSTWLTRRGIFLFFKPFPLKLQVLSIFFCNLNFTSPGFASFPVVSLESSIRPTWFRIC